MIVCIPTIGRSSFLPAMLDTIEKHAPDATVMAMDNLCDEQSMKVIRLIGRRPGMEWHGRPGVTIYDQWNNALARGEAEGRVVALLNDDLVLHPAALQLAEQDLLARPEYALMGMEYRNHVGPGSGIREVIGTFRTGGFGGFAFLVAPGPWRVHEGFRWWYGDDDLANCIRISHGRRLGVSGQAHVVHPVASTTGNQFAWTSEAAAEDAALYRRLWPTAP